MDGSSGLTMRVRLRKLAQATTLVVLIMCGTFAVLHIHSLTSPNTTWQGDRTSNHHNASGVQLQNSWAVVPRILMTGKDYEYESGINVNTVGTDDMDANSIRHTYQYATATAKPIATLDDLFISVKTTKNYHQLRLDVILKTWFTLARDQTWFFTDAEDEEFEEKTHGHLINTNCSSSHNRKALCCKMAVEFDTFLESNKRWFCHFDDDNYVNVPQLVRLLQNYNWQEDWYLGKPSIRAPLEILNRDDSSQQKLTTFWFATGGAGFCISRSLALKMMPIASGGKFISIGEKIRLPDDVTMGYVIEHVLGKRLTVVEEFHSHLEPMRFLKPEELANQVSFSYSKYGQEMNVVRVEGFDERLDSTRFLSLHCLLFPNFSFCPR